MLLLTLATDCTSNALPVRRLGDVKVWHQHAGHIHLCDVSLAVHVTHMLCCLSLQDWEARAVQCESDLTFQSGQVQQSYIGTVCLQLQQHMATYLMAAVSDGGRPSSGVHPAAVDLVTSLVEVQADLMCLAPPTCLTQVRPVLPHPTVCAMPVTTGHILFVGAGSTSTCAQFCRHMMFPVQPRVHLWCLESTDM